MKKTFLDAQILFTESLKAAGKANATVIAYSKDIEQLVTFVTKKGKTDVDEVSSDDIDEFKALLNKQRYTGKSISRKINSIKAFFRYLISQGMITSNPAEIITHPKYEQSPPRVLSKIEYRALRDACRGDARMSAVVEILLQTGMRISELAALQMGDVDFERNIIVIQPLLRLFFSPLFCIKANCLRDNKTVRLRPLSPNNRGAVRKFMPTNRPARTFCSPIRSFGKDFWV